ncbi:MAG TPA: Rrf2 family transcriptional regulator [Asticcacaulis sp.]
MHLTTYTDYALRVLIYLNAHVDRRPTIGEIADKYGISKNHLVKCAQQLGRAGFLVNTRGRSGGLALARPADQITLGEVVRRMEPEMDIVPCMDRDNHSCVISEVCGMKPVFHEAREAFLRVLDGYSVADITRNRLSLLRLLPAA